MRSESKFVINYQEYFMTGKVDRCLGMTIWPTLCADCHVLWNPQPAGTLMVFPGLYRDCFSFFNGL